MRFLGIGETNDLGDMYLRLIRAGHQVRVFVADESSRDVMNRMLDFTNDWRAELSWIREAGDEGIILFESASAGETQDELRNEGLNVIGGSALGDRLEQDRGYAQQVLRDLGLQTAWTREFTTFDDGIAFVTASPGRYVFKLNGANWPSTRNYVGQMQSGADMLALLRVTRDNWDLAEIPSFVLMEHITGVEVGVGAFFNGESFLGTPNLDWEHKRFFPGDLGELTGEMGTIVTYRGGERLFDATLAHLAPMLRDSGYVGYINLNTIVNEAGVWPLELTCRFGYPGFAILDSLHAEEWGSIFATLIRRDRQVIETRSGFSAGVVLTVPTFPYSDGYSDVGCGTPICFTETMTEADRDALHLGEVTTAGDQLMTAGVIGYIMVVTGVGDTVEEACRTAYETAEKVIIPNVRYRNDIGARLIREDYAAMKSLGWLD